MISEASGVCIGPYLKYCIVHRYLFTRSMACIRRILAAHRLLFWP